MAGSIFGRLFRVVTFGESHGKAIGCVIDGCPAGVPLAAEDIEAFLRRRRPGTGDFSSQRAEDDIPEILSGLFEGKTLGTPIAVIIRNRDQNSADYEALKDVYRPGHADKTWDEKYGFRDYRGGGRSSGRETAARVAAGAVAAAFLAGQGISIHAWISRAAGIDTAHSPEAKGNGEADAALTRALESIREQGDSAGGIVSCRIRGAGEGLGEPVFGKLHARLGEAILSIGACKGFEAGAGFAAADLSGSQNNADPEAAGGSAGGISDGSDIFFRAAFKPTPSIRKKQIASVRGGAVREVEIGGRHDVCILPRVVPVVEAMAALTIADLVLENRSSRA